MGSNTCRNICFSGVESHGCHMSDPRYMVQCLFMPLHKSSPKIPDISKDGRVLRLKGEKEKGEKEQITWKQMLSVLHYFFTLKR